MDYILEKFFEPERWIYAIEKGVGKSIAKSELYQLTKPETRVQMYEAIRDGCYEIAPPHTAQIPKDNGEYRTVYINEPADRILLSITNDLLFELMPEMIHPHCQSYQKAFRLTNDDLPDQFVYRLECNGETLKGVTPELDLE